MRYRQQASRHLVRATALAILLPISFSPSALAVELQQVSLDNFDNRSAEHRTQAKADTFSWNSTVVSAFQTGRYKDGGATAIGFATSHDGGLTWFSGTLPAITRDQEAGIVGRVSDPSVAFDPKHGVWMVMTLGIDDNDGVRGVTVLVSRSTNGIEWGAPAVVARTGGFFDKTWVACDTTSTSPYFGNCYGQWDDVSVGGRVKMSTSSDGGLSWGEPRDTADLAEGLAGQPVVPPNGTVVVPFVDSHVQNVLAFRSIDGGATWDETVWVAPIFRHFVAGRMRSHPLPSAEVDSAGRVYLVWHDCRFRSFCSANDIVLTTSDDGVTWKRPARIPTSPTTSNVDHFIPGIGVDRSTSGGSARLALTYYFFPNASCSFDTCELHVGYTSSADGGTTWTPATSLAGPMRLDWIVETTQGPMVGDYLSTSIVNGRAVTVFAVGSEPEDDANYDQEMFTVPGGLPIGGHEPSS